MKKGYETLSLTGRIVRLEPLSESHHAGLCEVGLDEDLWKVIPYRVTTPAEMAAYITKAQAESALAFATIKETHPENVGSTRPAEHQTDNRRVEIGSTFVGKAWQRTAVP